MTRLLIVDNFQIRRYGRVREGAGQRFYYGAIRNNWRVMTFSERDITRYLSPFGFMRAIGAELMNRRLIETAKNFRPDVILIGNSDYLTNKSIEEIRRLLPGTKIAHVNVDAIWQEHTCNQIAARMQSCDAVFVTTAGENLKTWVTGKNVVAYMPNPCDLSIDGAMPSVNPKYDLFFAGRFAEGDERLDLLEKIIPLIEDKISLGIFGCFGRGCIRGRDYERVLGESAMALNLNRREGWKWYSSDRIAHLMANGVCTFISVRSELQRFFTPDKEAVFFEDADDLVEKVRYYGSHDETRREIAAAGRRRYFELFNSARVLKYLIETTCGEPYSENYEWVSEVYRSR